MNFLSRRRRPWSIALALVVVLGTVSTAPLSAQSTSGELQTVAVVAISSYEDILSDIGFAGSLANRPELGQMLEGMIALFTQGKGLVSIDKSMPWGVIVQTDGMNFMPVGCLPVTDFTGALDLLRGFGIPVVDGDDGIVEISTPDGKTLYLKHSGSWAYFSESTDSLALLPEDPESTLAPLVEDYDLGAVFYAQNVPEMYRQLVVGAIQGGMQSGMTRVDGESDEAFEARQAMTEQQMAQIEMAIKEVDELSIGWALDAEQQRSYLDINYGFLPGGELAQQLAGYSEPRTNFAGFFQPDAAVTMSIASEIDPELIQRDLEQMRAALQTARAQVEQAIDEEQDLPDDETREIFKSAFGDFLDAVQTTIETGRMDAGAALHLKPGELTLVAGMLVKQPEKVESGLKQLASIAEQEPDFPGFEWDAASHAGVRFHTVSVPLPDDEDKAREMFGDEVEMAVGIGNEAIYVAVGSDGLQALQDAIDASAAEPNKKVVMAEVSISLAQIMTLAAENADEAEREFAESVADMLNSQAQGRDHIRITVKLIENGIRYRFEAEEGVLRVFGLSASEAGRKLQQLQ